MSRATGIIEGFVAVDPRVNKTQSGLSVANVTVPHTPRKFDKQANEWVDNGPTTWFVATVWNEAADLVAQTIQKGDVVRIVGDLVAEEYQRNDGSTGHKVTVRSASVALVEKGKSKGGQAGAGQAQNGSANPGQGGGGWAAPGANNGPSANQPWADTEPPF